MKTLTRRQLISAVVLVCASLLALVALSACGSPATGVKSYANEKFGYSFEYPAAWKLQEGDSAEISAGGEAAGAVGVFDPDGAVAEDTYIDLAQVTIYQLTQTIDASLMPAVRTEVEAVVASLESQAEDMKTVEALAETTVGGMPGFKATYTLTQNGAPTTTSLYFLFSGATEYQVTLQAATENWAANQPVFAALLASFKPGPGQ